RLEKTAAASRRPTTETVSCALRFAMNEEYLLLACQPANEHVEEPRRIDVDSDLSVRYILVAQNWRIPGPGQSWRGAANLHSCCGLFLHFWFSLQIASRRAVTKRLPCC